MSKPVQPTSAIQLLVEGKDQGNFFGELVKYLKIEDLQIQDFGGVNELKGFLGVMVKQSGFHDTVRMLGIVRDAETSAQGAFQSVQSSLRNAGLPVPVRPGDPIGAAPTVNVLILPGNGAPGMLETLLCRTFADTAADRCIDDFFKCFEQSEAGAHIPNPDKARAGFPGDAEEAAYVRGGGGPEGLLGSLRPRRLSWDPPVPVITARGAPPDGGRRLPPEPA